MHGRVFGDVRPANTLLQVAGLIGDGYLVEIEAEAVVGASSTRLSASGQPSAGLLIAPAAFSVAILSPL